MTIWYCALATALHMLQEVTGASALLDATVVLFVVVVVEETSLQLLFFFLKNSNEVLNRPTVKSFLNVKILL